MKNSFDNLDGVKGKGVFKILIAFHVGYDEAMNNKGFKNRYNKRKDPLCWIAYKHGYESKTI
jgi:hypothetical protein